jgi:hypothetical protein
MGTAEDFLEPLPRGAFALEVLEELAIGGDEDAGAAQEKSDLVIFVAFLDEQGDTGKSRNVVFDGGERMIKSGGDLVGFVALEVKANGLDAMGLSGADVLLLSARGDFDVAFAKRLDIANDGADAAIEESVGEVFVAEQTALIACFGGHAEDAGAAKSFDFEAESSLIVVGAGIEGKRDGDLLTLFDGFAGGFVGGDDKEFDFAESEGIVGIVGGKGEDVFDGLEDGRGDEGRAVGSLFDLAAKETIERFGIETIMAMFFVNEFGSHHDKHLKDNHLVVH